MRALASVLQRESTCLIPGGMVRDARCADWGGVAVAASKALSGGVASRTAMWTLGASIGDVCKKVSHSPDACDRSKLSGMAEHCSGHPVRTLFRPRGRHRHCSRACSFEQWNIWPAVADTRVVRPGCLQVVAPVGSALLDSCPRSTQVVDGRQPALPGRHRRPLSAAQRGRRRSLVAANQAEQIT